MDSLDSNPTPAPDRLADFCRVFLDENRAEWPVHENKLAAAFVEFFKLHFCHGEALKKLCQELNILFSEVPLPRGVKGYNHLYNGERTIIISTDQAIPGASFEHTVLHELRELMEYVFQELGARTATHEELEKRAEGFAGAVRMTTAGNGLASLFGDARLIETTWKRRLAYLAIAIAGLFYVTACGLLPSLEDHFSEP